ncbi:MAG: DUF1330 domain-containing protein [Actinomycetota bacterium]
MSDTSVYLIVELEITEPERFWSDYAAHLAPIHERHGVEILLGGPPAEIVEGVVAQNFVAVLRFPSAAAQRAWYEDPEYQPLKARRLGTTNSETSRVMLAPAFAPPG